MFDVAYQMAIARATAAEKALREEQRFSIRKSHEIIVLQQEIAFLRTRIPNFYDAADRLKARK